MMSVDIDIIKARANNEYRLSKVRGEAMISVRIPGGILPAHLLTVAREIAETWGNGQIHLTTRQKLAMPGIRYEDIDRVNAALEPFIREIEMELCDVQVDDPKAGYLAIGGRNIVACLKNGKATKEESLCIGCGECVLACPTLAWQRQPQEFWQVHLGGRTGKKTPRMGKLFLNWVTEDVIRQVITNLFEFEKEMLDGKPVYLHMGHLIDRGGYLRFKERVLRNVQLNPEEMVAGRIYWAEDESAARIHLKPGSVK